MTDQPFGQTQATIAFLMTDMVGSSRLWEADRAGMGKRIALFDEIMHRQVQSANGTIIRPRGEGDSHFALFPSATDAVLGAIAIHQGISAATELNDFQLRIAIHLGTAETIGGDLYGPALNRGSRIRQAANPGQILVSEAIQVLAAPEGRFGLKHLGPHRLRDLMEPERLFQVMHSDLEAEFGPLDTLSNLSHNLPYHPDSFVGREHEIAELQRALELNRMVTIVGPGGVGKTRLALQVAAERAENYKHGVWFIDLAQTERAESVLPILCEVLEPGLKVSEEGLLRAIEHRQALLILDNCEHLVEECRRFVRSLTRACPNMSVLATSRRPLEVSGELIYRLSGLRLPASDQLSEAYRFEGFRLFAERAAKKATGLNVNEMTVPGMVDLCQRVDGLPLAIEIVARLTNVLSVREISDQLQDCLDMPMADRTGDPRQHTIASTIEWSRGFLTLEAQDLLRRVTFFPNTWTLDGLKRVCLPDQTRVMAITLLQELVSHSLVFSSTSTRGDVRFGMLQVARQVLSRDSGDQSEMVLPFIAYCHHIIAQAKILRESGEEKLALELINLEWETIIKALQFSREISTSTCAEIALSMNDFWMRGTRMPEGRTWYERLADSDQIDMETRVKLQVALSSLYILLGENDRALRVLLAAEKAVLPNGGYDLVRVVANLAVLHDRMGRYEEAELGFSRACELFHECGARLEEASMLLNLGVAKLRLNRPLEASRELFARALESAQAAGSVSQQARAHSSLGHVCFKEGDLKGALHWHSLALVLWQEALDIPYCELSVLELSEIFVALGEFLPAAKAVHIAERLEEVSQSPFPDLHRARLDNSRESTRPHVQPADWKAAQRLTRAKSAPELVTLAIQTIDEVARSD